MLDRFKIKFIVFGYCLLLANNANISLAQTEPLTRLLPDDTNVLVLINEAELFASELSISNGWNQQKKEAYYTHKTVIPPGVEDYVLGASVDFEFGHQNWEIALLRKTSEGMSPEAVAKKLNGEVDKIGDKNAIVLPDDTFLVRFSESIVGAISPANRQYVSRWIKNSESNSESQLPVYLKNSLMLSDIKKNHLVLAFDLTDALPPEIINERLTKAGVTVNKKLTALMSKLKGATVTISVTDKIEAKIMVDFGQNPKQFERHGKKVVMEVLGKYGLLIEGISTWDASTKFDRFELTGPLKESDLREIFKMVQPTGLNSAKYKESSSVSNTKDVSIQYLKSLSRLYAEIKKHKKQTIHLHDRWVGRNIDEIESLNVVNVDEEIVAFSEDLTTRYRHILDTLEREKNTTKLLKAGAMGRTSGARSQYYNYTGNRYYYGVRRNRNVYTRKNASRVAQRKIGKQQEAKTSQLIADSFSEIEELVKKFRNKMRIKYQITL